MGFEGVDSSRSGYGLVAGSCGHGNKFGFLNFFKLPLK
jgi:hypothetical protein